MPATVNDYTQAVQNAFGGGYRDVATGEMVYPNASKAANTYNTKVASVSNAVLDPASGLWKDKTTGAIWTGAVQNADGTTSQAQNGKILPQDAYGNTLPVFTAQTTVKQPEIAAAASGLLGTSTATNAATNASFNDYLAQAKTLNAQGADQLKVDQAAVDPTATVNRLNTDTANTTATLNQNNQNYQTAQQGVQANIAAENTTAAQTTADRLAALKSTLDAENAQYAASEQAVAGQAYAKAQKGISLYQLGSGTPTSGSGNLSNRYIKAYADINVPLQADLANRQISETNQLDTQQQAADKSSYDNLISYYSGQSALNSDVANRMASTAEYTGNLDAATATQIQQLKTSTAGMSRAMAAQYLQQLQVPFSVGSQVLAGQISNLQGIQGIESGANYYNIDTPYDPSRVPVTTTNTTTNPGSAPASVRPQGNNQVSSNNYSAATTTGTGGTTQPVGQTTVAQRSDGSYVYVDSVGNQFDANGNLVSTPTGAQRIAQTAVNYQAPVAATGGDSPGYENFTDMG